MAVGKRAFEADVIALSYGSGPNDVLLLIAGVDNPGAIGVSAPVSTVYFKTDGQIWRKDGAGDADWTPTLGAGRMKYLKGKLGATGLSSGVVNQAVDGSASPQSFFVGASVDFDIYIQQMTAVISDRSVKHNKFGSLKSLSVGWDVKLTQDGVESFVIEKAKSGGEAIIQSGLGRAFGDKKDAFELSDWSSKQDAQVISVPFGDFIPGGLHLEKGSSDKLESIVNDELTGLDEFSVFIYGYRNE